MKMVGHCISIHITYDAGRHCVMMYVLLVQVAILLSSSKGLSEYYESSSTRRQTIGKIMHKCVTTLHNDSKSKSPGQGLEPWTLRLKA